MDELWIKNDLDKGIIHVRFRDIDNEIPLVEFAKLSLEHLTTGKSMSGLLRNYFKDGANAKDSGG